MMIAKYDAALSFGKAALASATAFPDELFLDKADPARMAVHVTIEGAAGGTSIAFKIQGKNEGGTYTDVSTTPAVALADLNKGVDIPVPQGWNYQYMKVTMTKSGSFTAGEALAALDVYQGV